MIKYQSIPHVINLSGKYVKGATLQPLGVCTGGVSCETCIQINEGEIGHTEPHVHFEEYQARQLNDGDWIILPNEVSPYFDTIPNEQLLADYQPVNEGRIEAGQEESMWQLLARDLDWDAVAAATPGWMETLKVATAPELLACSLSTLTQVARNHAIKDQCQILLMQHGFAPVYAQALLKFVFQHFAENVKGEVRSQPLPAGTLPQWRQRLQPKGD